MDGKHNVGADDELRNGKAGSSYVSTLSHALNITTTPRSSRFGDPTTVTPTSSSKHEISSPGPTYSAHSLSSHTATSTPFRTPSRSRSAQRDQNLDLTSVNLHGAQYSLSLRGHESFSPICENVSTSSDVAGTTSTGTLQPAASASDSPFEPYPGQSRDLIHSLHTTDADDAREKYRLSMSRSDQCQGDVEHEKLAVREHDHDWFMSGSSQHVPSNAFRVALKTSTPALALMNSTLSIPPFVMLPARMTEGSEEAREFHSLASPRPHSHHQTSALAHFNQVGDPPTSASRQTTSFKSYRDRASSDAYPPKHDAEKKLHATLNEPLSPASEASLSPTQFSSAFPPGVSDGSFLSAIFEQQTPSISTHLLPSNDLTAPYYGLSEHPTCDQGLMAGTTSMSPVHDGYRISQSRSFQPLSSQPLAHLDRTVIGSNSVPSFRTTPKASIPAAYFTGSLLSHAHQDEISSDWITSPPVPAGTGSQRAQSIRNQINEEEEQRFSPSRSNTSNREHSIIQNLTKQGSTGAASTETELAGLGLNLSLMSDAQQEHIEQLRPEFSSHQNETPPSSSIQVDEMGRWVMAPALLRASNLSLTTSSRGRSSNGTGSYSRRGGWHSSDLSLGTADLSNTSGNSSSVDTSFQDESDFAASDSARSDYGRSSIDAPLPSIGQSARKEDNVAQTYELKEKKTQTTIPKDLDVLMHDFSEFGQSVSIENMAEDRWRTWPRNREKSNKDIETSSPSISPLAPATEVAVPLVSQASNAGDSLSLSHSSLKPRLMAEPYNKNQRSGRPSSSASTSSRSSASNAVSADLNISTGVTGPTRPRSHLASASLRMSNTSRPLSGTIEPANSTQEGTSASAIALRRARGKSQGSFGMIFGGMQMEQSRSMDSTSRSNASRSGFSPIQNLKMQRTKTSDTLHHRPHSMIESSPARSFVMLETRSPSKLGLDNGKSKVGFNEVSRALDTLRVFLRQKNGSESSTRRSEGDPTNSPVSVRSDTKSLTSDRGAISNVGSAEGNKAARTLRRAKGVIPPRGAFESVDEFGNLWSQNVTLGDSAETDPPSSAPKHFAGTRSAGGSSDSSHLVFHAGRPEDRLAVLEDLSERVAQLKEQAERQKELHAAASMPPPTRRPTPNHHRSYSSMTRREMHEEYLRKRSDGK